MQPLDAVDFRTADDVEYVLRVASSVEHRAGLELIDMNLNVLDDISDELLGGSITRDSYATLHGQANLSLSTALDWGKAIVRPYVVYTADGVSVRFNLGAYFTDMPLFRTGRTVPTYEVTGYDILQILDTPVGTSYQFTNTTVSDALTDIFDSLGVEKYFIDPSRATTTISKSWALDPTLTWLGVVNNILDMVGYRGIYSDQNGQLVCVPYISPVERTSEWTYDDDPYLSMHEPEFDIEHDLYNVPNRWVAVFNIYDEATPPTEGNGMYTVMNQYDGPTSIEARGGRIITKPLQFDATTQADLIAQTDKTVVADKLNPFRYMVTTARNPLHWHFDRVTFVDSNIGTAEVMTTSWTLPLSQGNEGMTHTWVTISGGTT